MSQRNILVKLTFDTIVCDTWHELLQDMTRDKITLKFMLCNS